MENNKFTPQQLIRLFITTDKLHRSLIEQKMSDLSLHRSQHIMLISICSFDSPPTQRQLAEKLDISAATVAVTIKKLESAGYVEKCTAEGDGRCNRIFVTEKGKSILCEAKKIFEEVDGTMFDGLSEDELLNFVFCLEKLQKNLRSSGASLPEKCCR